MMTTEEFEQLKQLADNGDVEAMLKLGVCYLEGRGVDKEEKKAVTWLEKAAEEGNTHAMNNLGACYLNGLGVLQDGKKAFDWFIKAADKDKDYADAMINLGLCYLEGQGVYQDVKKAVTLFTKFAERGNANAMNNLGVCYLNGKGVDKDETQAAKWVTKAADKDNANAMFNLGVYYLNGQGVVKDEKLAIKWFTKAADKDDTSAMNNLGVCYLNGLGVPQDDKQAAEWFTKAANKGKGNVNAMTSLGACYLNGLGVVKDEEQAFEWFTKAADRGNANAMFNLGTCYFNGQGVVKDEKQAVTWFEKAADNGNAYAMFNLGIGLLYGYKDVDKDEKQAVTWFKKAAQMGMSHDPLIFIMDDKNGFSVDVKLLAKEAWLELYFRVFRLFNEAADKLRSEEENKKDIKNEFKNLMFQILEIENKHLLKNSKDGLTHYTKQKVLDALLGGRKSSAPDTEQKIKENYPLRQHMAAFFNDPTEGHYVFDSSCIAFLEDVSESENLEAKSSEKAIKKPNETKKPDKIKMAETIDKVEKLFKEFERDEESTDNLPYQIFSLSLCKAKDKLDLWRAYSKDETGRVNGVALRIPAETLKSFISEASKGSKLSNISTIKSDMTLSGIKFDDKNTSQTESNTESQSDAQKEADEPFLLYEVKYGVVLVKELWEKLIVPLKQVLDSIDKINDNTDKNIREILRHYVALALIRLTYLYKHDAYKSEEEVRAIRLAKIDEAFVKLDDRAPARLYIDTPSLLFQHKDSEIILGPQMSSEERGALLWETRKRLLDLKLADKVKVSSSKLPFR